MTLQLHPPFRYATRADAGALLDLVNFAGVGLASYVWSQLAAAGESARDVGQRRAERDEGSFSYRNAVLADDGTHVIAGLVSYPLPAVPTPVTEDLPAMFVPMQQLENLACGTWHVNVLAAYPVHRGKGLGSSLIAIAGDLGREAGCARLSLIVSDANTRARRFYDHHGFRQVAASRMVKNGWSGPGENWLLLVRDA